MTMDRFSIYLTMITNWIDAFEQHLFFQTLSTLLYAQQNKQTNGLYQNLVCRLFLTNS